MLLNNEFYKKLKLGKFVKEKEDELFLALFILTLIVSIYFFTKTYSQALWFDEADYLNFGKYLAFGYPEWGLSPVRPPLFPLVSALFFKIGFGEIGLRIIMILSGLSNTVLIYLIGKELDNKRVGLIAAAIMALFWSHLFFTFRLLVDVPVLTLWLLSTYFFVKGYINEGKKKYIWMIAPALFIGFLIKYLNAFLIIIILVYLLMTERLKFLKDKDLWMSAGIGIIMSIPFFIFQKLYYGSFFAFLKASLVGRTTLGRTFTDFFVEYIKNLFPMVGGKYLWVGTLFSIIFIIGFIKILEIFLGLDLIFKNKDKKLTKELFLFLWLIGSLAFLAKLGYGHYIEERYAFGFFAAVFLIIAIGINKIYDSVKNYNKLAATALVILILVLGAYSNLAHAKLLIENKAESFIQVKQAGEFLQENLRKNEGYLSPATSAEIQYHSNRKNMGSNLQAALTDEKIKYVVISIFNQMPAGYLEFIQSNPDKFKPVETYFLDKENKQPAVIIFKIIRN